MMSRNYYDDDDYELEDIESVDEGEFFGDMDQDNVDMALQMEEFEVEFNMLLTQAEIDLAIAIDEGDTDRVERLQDEIELILMTDFNMKEMR